MDGFERNDYLKVSVRMGSRTELVCVCERNDVIQISDNMVGRQGE